MFAVSIGIASFTAVAITLAVAFVGGCDVKLNTLFDIMSVAECIRYSTKENVAVRVRTYG